MTLMTFVVWMVLNLLLIYNPRYLSFLDLFLLVKTLASCPAGSREREVMIRPTGSDLIRSGSGSRPRT